MASKDTISKIKDMLFPGSDAGDLSSDTLNTAILNINQYKSNSGRLGYVNLVRSLISKTQVGTSDDTTIFSGTPTGVGLYTPEAFGHGARLLRYKLYESIVENISYCHRALNVIVDNILSPDDITKISLVVKPAEDESSDETDYHVKSVERLISKLNIEKYLQRIIKTSLKSGDYFCEIADSKTAMTSQSFIAENEQYIADSTYVTSFEEVLIPGKNGKDSLKKRFILDFSSLAAETEPTTNTEPISENDEFLDESNDLIKEDIPVPSYSVGSDRDIPVKVDTGHRLDIENISDIHFLFHEGKHVIKLQSELYSICFGYLIFPKINILRRLNPQEEILNTICNKILKKVYEQIPQIRSLQEPEELKDIIKSIISRTSYSSNVIIRYVPPDRMTHFKLPCDKYFPYGESIFSSVEFSCKVLMALETSLAVQRINRSTEKRKIGIEIGLPRDARKLVEDLKMELNKRKVCLDDFSTIDAIPSAISTFEDMYVPQKDGTPFVDIQPYNGDITDVRSKVDELKFLRDQIVASLGVPPAFVGIEENLCCDISTTYIPLLSGERISLEEVIRNFEQGKDLWTYSYDRKTGKTVPGKITWAGKTKLQTKCVRVWFDNEKFLDVTPEHPFMLRDGSYKEAHLLKEEDSLMPLYTKNSNYVTAGGHPYESVYHPGSNTWQLTHRSIAENLGYVVQGDGKDVHHKDFNPQNNLPSNLIGLTKYEHFCLHGKEDKKEQTLRKVTVIRRCKICDVEFELPPAIDKVTCSSECLSKYHSQTGLLSWQARSKNYPERIVNCALCGKERKFYQENFNPNMFYSCQTNKECTKFVRVLNKITENGTKLFSDIEYSNCEVCNKPIILSSSKNKITNTCNKMSCINKVKKGKQKDFKLYIELTCPICNETFSKPQWYMKLCKNSPTCGKKECYQENMKRINIERYKDNKVKTICLVCGNEFECNKYHYDTTKYPRCEKQECKNEIMFISNHENKRVANLNHKVTKVELLEGLYDTGDIRIEKYHNFATEAGVFIHNSNKNALSNENILFARCVINYQKTFSEQITELIKKILICIDPQSAPTLLDDITIAFPVPRSLQYENESRWTQDLINMIRSLQEVGVPIEWSKKKYLTSVDWTEVEKFETDEKIDKEFTKPIDKDIEDTSSGGMGGMGGLGGMDMSGLGGLGSVPSAAGMPPGTTEQQPSQSGDEFKF
jgi:hypothetical protein